MFRLPQLLFPRSSRAELGSLSKHRSNPKTEHAGVINFAGKPRMDHVLVAQRRVQSGKKGKSVKDFHIVFIASPNSGCFHPVCGNAIKIVLKSGGTGRIIEEEVPSGLLLIE